MDKSILPAPYIPQKNAEEQARRLFENCRWPKGSVCPACGSQHPIYRQTRNGVSGYYRCPNKDNHPSGKPLVFTVRTGTLLERSHVPLDKWLFCLHWFARLPSEGWIPTASAFAKIVDINRKTATSLVSNLEDLRYGEKSDDPTNKFLFQLMIAILEKYGDLRQAKK